MPRDSSFEIVDWQPLRINLSAITKLLICWESHDDLGPCLIAAERHDSDAIILLGEILPAHAYIERYNLTVRYEWLAQYLFDIAWRDKATCVRCNATASSL